MSLLHDHFERVKEAEQSGRNIIRATYYDLMGTLFFSDGTFNLPLIDFAKWNYEKKLLGDNHLFTNGTTGGFSMLNRGGFTEETTGVKTMEYKLSVYQEALTSRQHIALVIDDSDPSRGGDFVLTWWNPNSREVREFLEEKQYLDFAHH